MKKVFFLLAMLSVLTLFGGCDCEKCPTPPDGDIIDGDVMDNDVDEDGDILDGDEDIVVDGDEDDDTIDNDIDEDDEDSQEPIDQTCDSDRRGCIDDADCTHCIGKTGCSGWVQSNGQVVYQFNGYCKDGLCDWDILEDCTNPKPEISCSRLECNPNEAKCDKLLWGDDGAYCEDETGNPGQCLSGDCVTD